MFRRALSSLATTTPKNVQTCKEYLRLCENSGASTTSTVFRGTLYELLAKQKLEAALNFSNLVRVGGSGDNGLDLIGTWNLSKYETGANKAAASSLLSLTKQFSKRKNAVDLSKDVVVLIQCKNHKSKMKASTIRELAGIREFHIDMKSKVDKSKTFMVLLSPLPLTKQAQGQADMSDVPIIHALMKPLLRVKDSKNEYNLDNWKGGELGPVYMNFTARVLLQGLSVAQNLSEILR